MCGPSDPARAQRAGRHSPSCSHRAGAPAPGAPAWPHSSLRQDIASPRTRSDHRPPRARARRPPDAPWSAFLLAAPTTHGRLVLPVRDACVLSPSSMLRLRCALSLLGSASLWGRTTGDRHHPFRRLHHTGRAHPARRKRDAHRQGYTAAVSSTCHADLLVPVARGFREVALAGVGHPETHHRTRVAGVFVEYLSRTLSAS